ncbi:hypothetical protein DCS_05984 [Drechmeria coniospora]|uniref:Secreted protein n=1 Tax=Drechmeria coniospora TaxID=98403 RepID=A0A151GAC3_DRECN|nr:hypothetical protein DCS_05984 [Drechmeria coniospora]KYK54030.1 hypothetical protein DCS_05984 [Drechmeria coniospora]ODA78912.1 hypothetical protein RJ55_04502 [Drechmeria coniospora]
MRAEPLCPLARLFLSLLVRPLHGLTRETKENSRSLGTHHRRRREESLETTDDMVAAAASECRCVAAQSVASMHPRQRPVMTVTSLQSLHVKVGWDGTERRIVLGSRPLIDRPGEEAEPEPTRSDPIGGSPEEGKAPWVSVTQSKKGRFLDAGHTRVTP